MRLLVLCLLSALAWCQYVDLGKIPFTFEIPESWTIQTSKNKKSDSVVYYCNSPKRIRYELAMIHVESVLLTVKKNASPYDGIVSETDRKKRIDDLVKVHNQRKNAHATKQKGIEQYEKEGIQHISFTSSAPAYDGRMFHLVHHVITESFTFVFFCSAILDEEIENSMEHFKEIIDSFKPRKTLSSNAS